MKSNKTAVILTALVLSGLFSASAQTKQDVRDLEEPVEVELPLL
jgi:hypothetical protein